MKLNLSEKIKKLPKTPGVYIFCDARRAILYVGKATSLRSRVASYFVPSPAPMTTSGATSPNGRGGFYERPVESAINQIFDVKTIETETVLEAFILEQDLIKRLQPKYNAMGKDDKSFSYAVITKEEFPRVLLLRKTELETLKWSDRSRPKRPKAVGPLSTVYGPYTSKKQIEIALKILRKIFPYHSKSQKTEKGCLDSQIGLCPGPYDGKISRADYLKNIRGIRMILEGKKKGLVKKLEKEMKGFSKNHEYEKAAVVRNQTFALKHIRDVAMIFRESPLPPMNTSSDLSRRERWNIKKPFRIEAYDISNISGQHAVGSMVVFDNINGQFEPNKSEYRKFKIKTIQGADDVGMMKEVLTRRFHNDWPASTRRDSSTRGWPKPDLILLDGGVGHLHMAEELLKNLKLSITLVAVAKGPTRKMSNVKCQMSNQFLNPKSKGFIINLLNNKIFIKNIMDEAHRFAIMYHKKVRKRNFI